MVARNLWPSPFFSGWFSIRKILRWQPCNADCIRREGKVLACFLDVKGAFDNVNSDILMKKLSTMWCARNIVNLVSFLTHERNVKFVVNDAYTFTRKVFRGLPQGGVLNPLLYLIYVNDIAVDLNSSIHISQFADDIAIYFPITIPSKSKRTLEKTIITLGANLDHLGLSLASEKTIPIHFNQKGIRSSLN